MADTPAKPTLLDLAKIRFVDDISPAEKKLFEATEKGERVDCGEDSGERGIIRSDRFSWLCTDPHAAAYVTYRGVSIVRAKIEDEVDLQWANISFPLRIRHCVLTKAIILQNSHLLSLDLAETSIRNLRAENLVTKRDVALSAGFEAEGTVDLTGGKIGGNLDCTGGKFVNKSEAQSFIALSAKVEGNVFFA